MGNKASKPARKLTKTISVAQDVGKDSSGRIRLPPQELKEKFENSVLKGSSGPDGRDEPSEPIKRSPAQHGQNIESALTRNTARTFGAEKQTVPEGKDGMDPQADQDYIKFISGLGKQVHSQTAELTNESNVMALKQLLNRKELFEKGQSEVQAQLKQNLNPRTMIHPRTLTAIINAMNESKTSNSDIMQDYQVGSEILRDLERFRVADTVEVFEEATKEDEVGPRMGSVGRAATDPEMMDENGPVSESVDQQRMKELKSRLE